MPDLKISALTAKATPVSADTLVIVDSVGGVNKKITAGTMPVSTAQASADTAVQNFAIARANHTGSQGISTVTSLQSALNDKVEQGNNIGVTGSGIYKDKTGTQLNFRRIIQGSGIIITPTSDDITIEASPLSSGQIPNSTSVVSTPQSTTSGTFVDIPGMTGVITTTANARIASTFTSSFGKTGGGKLDGEIRISLVSPSENGNAISFTVSGSSDAESVSCQFTSTVLPPGTYTVKAEYRILSGTTDLVFNSGTIFIQGQQGAQGPAGPASAWGIIPGTLSAQTDLQNALDAKENSITAGTSAQYFRGDKTLQTLDNAAVGLSNVPNVDARARSSHTGTQLASTVSDFDTQVAVTALLKANNLSGLTNTATARTNLGIGNIDNTSDANKPVSTAQQTALNLKSNLAGGNSFTGAQAFGDGEISRFNATIVTDTTTTRTLSASDNGKVIRMNNAAAITVTVPNTLAAGFNCMVIQAGAGVITVAGSGGMVVNNRQAQLKTAGQHAATSLLVTVTNLCNFMGDTQA